MPVREIAGDLFTCGVPVIGHGVNLQGVMGSGIAPIFKKKYPLMFTEYQKACKNHTLSLGEVMPYHAPDLIIVLNMATQDKPGPNATLTAIYKALTAAAQYCEQKRIKEFAIPRIGAGIGGLKWEDVKHVIDRVGSRTPVLITIVTLPTVKS